MYFIHYSCYKHIGYVWRGIKTNPKPKNSTTQGPPPPFLKFLDSPLECVWIGFSYEWCDTWAPCFLEVMTLLNLEIRPNFNILLEEVIIAISLKLHNKKSGNFLGIKDIPLICKYAIISESLFWGSLELKKLASSKYYWDCLSMQLHWNQPTDFCKTL